MIARLRSQGAAAVDEEVRDDCTHLALPAALQLVILLQLDVITSLPTGMIRQADRSPFWALRAGGPLIPPGHRRRG